MNAQLDKLYEAVIKAAEFLRKDCCEENIAYELELASAMLSESCRQRLEVFPKKEFGKDRFYPHNYMAKELAEIIGCKSFTAWHLQKFSKIGYEVVPIYDLNAFTKQLEQASKGE